jgi:hypothetical protein
MEWFAQYYVELIYSIIAGITKSSHPVDSGAVSNVSEASGPLRL